MKCVSISSWMHFGPVLPVAAPVNQHCDLLKGTLPVGAHFDSTCLFCFLSVVMCVVHSSLSCLSLQLGNGHQAAETCSSEEADQSL